MKTTFIPRALAGLGVISIAVVLLRPDLRAQTSGPSAEYVTISWAGRVHTHLVYPGGRGEFIGSELSKLTRPERCDERAFYLNAAMNGLVKDGWRFAGMTSDEVVMQRGVGP